jgi:ribosomal protein S18 acetylase RimI-like enzyme
MDETGIRVVGAGPARDAYLPLLYLADDSVQQVLGYYQTGDLYGWDDPEGEPVAMVLAIPLPDGAVELKAVAVAPGRQGQRVGQRLLAAVLASLQRRGVARVVVGTGNSGIGQFAFYQKAGFRFWRVERDFFTPERGYPEGIQENGIPLRDMIWLDIELPSGGERSPGTMGDWAVIE